MVVNERPSKRMKRRVSADLYDFLTFPAASDRCLDDVIVGGQPFRKTVQRFLTNYAMVTYPPSLFSSLMTWQILFRIGGLVDGSDLSPAFITLHIVEEDVTRSRSSVYCDQCRVVGWSGHPVCGKRYHFIIKADGTSIGGYHKPCMCCGDILHLSESKCKSCNHVTTTDDVEDWVYHQLESTTHLLHGVVHANGFGHLLRVNGREGGSKFLSGCHIMDFWDRLCQTLGIRKVSVMDVSKKYGLEYRLLHAITKGHPWYGHWDYQFGSGSYGLTHESYKSAVEFVSNMPLSTFLYPGQKCDSRVQDMISYYQSLSKNELVNIRDLFCFLLGLIHDARKTAASKNVDDITGKKRRVNATEVSSWTKSDIECVEEAMLRVLRAVSGSNWVSWRALRGAVCKVASPELLDHCLGELGGKVVLGAMVNTRCNPFTGAFEYRLETVNSSRNEIASNISAGLKYPSEVTLLHDLRYFYNSLLHPQMMLSYDPGETRAIAMSSAQKLIDCKQFVKDFKPETLPLTNPSKIRFSCLIELDDESEDFAAHLPPELVILPVNATISDLKLEAENAFQDVYVMFRRLQIDELVGYNVDDSSQVKHLSGSMSNAVRLRGKCTGKNGLSKFQMERGTERWTVDCSCGARDDDGERMLACDICGVWRHTRCSGIHDADPVPARFVCPKCQNCDLKPKPNGACEDDILNGITANKNCLLGPSDVR